MHTVSPPSNSYCNDDDSAASNKARTHKGWSVATPPTEITKQHQEIKVVYRG
jgi:hypothetical protein